MRQSTAALHADGDGHEYGDANGYPDKYSHVDEYTDGYGHPDRDSDIVAAHRNCLACYTLHEH